MSSGTIKKQTESIRLCRTTGGRSAAREETGGPYVSRNKYLNSRYLAVKARPNRFHLTYYTNGGKLSENSLSNKCTKATNTFSRAGPRRLTATFFLGFDSPVGGRYPCYYNRPTAARSRGGLDTMAIGQPGNGSGAGREAGIPSGLSCKSRPRGGLSVLLPGVPQWLWGQRERGFVLFASYIASSAIALFAWGTVSGLALLIYAYLTHVVSISDALAQESFPPQSRRVRGIGVSIGLGLCIYVPILTLAMLFAWPGLRGGSEADGYLVNRWSYRGAEPRSEEWVCYRATPESEPRVGRIVAVDGQNVEWLSESLHVNSRRVDALEGFFRGHRRPKKMSFRIPEGHVLIHPEGRAADGAMAEGLVIVARDRIIGRAWARIYPIRERHLLTTGRPPIRFEES